MKYVHILGVKIHAISLEETVQAILKSIQARERKIIVTPGPEFLVRAYSNESFRKLLNQADLALPDGTGLVFASGAGIRQRVTGIDLMTKILPVLQEKAIKLALVLNNQGLTSAERLESTLHKRWPELTFSIVSIDRDWQSSSKTLLDKQLNDFEPQVLLVGLGSPQQEQWMHYYRSRIKTKAILIGVGGAFDMLCDMLPRAPYGLRRMGLEWLWRLIQQPRRLGRIATATVVFPLLVAKEYLSKKIIHKISQHS